VRTPTPARRPRSAPPAVATRPANAPARGATALPLRAGRLLAADPEEPLVETPTSFMLDLRRTRTPAEALDESDVDPNGPLVLAAGDGDVTWEAAAIVGDEAPGGDNPTPDMDVVDLIGRSLGVEYEDAEELKGAEKIAERDRHRWELDPHSAEDYRDRKRS